jgi:hypothetical protein
MCGWVLKGILAAMPARSIIFCKPDTVNGAPRSLTKANGDLAARFSARSARSSSPSNGCVPATPPLVVQWQQQIQISASIMVIGFGIFRFVNQRHPRTLARIRPTQLAIWSFAVAIAHGAGLMLVPIYLGLCRTADLSRGHDAAGALINANLGMAVLVSVVHSVAMLAVGGFLAWLVYRYLGLKFVSRSWFNLDTTWAFSLILVGALSLVISLAS